MLFSVFYLISAIFAEIPQGGKFGTLISLEQRQIV